MAVYTHGEKSNSPAARSVILPILMPLDSPISALTSASQRLSLEIRSLALLKLFQPAMPPIANVRPALSHTPATYTFHCLAPQIGSVFSLFRHAGLPW